MKPTFYYNELLMAAIDDLKGQRVLVSPLDWGLGHASRCVPIVWYLLEMGKDVVIAGSGSSFALLRKEFPDLEAVELDGMIVHYSHHRSQVWTLVGQLPSMLKAMRKEHERIAAIVQEYRIDTIVSDNRFGLWCEGVESVYITHQLMVKLPWWCCWAEGIVRRWHRRVIAHYTYCWVPDVEGKDNLSGDLSHKYSLPRNARWVGWLSRFEGVQTSNELRPYRNVAVLSGPEPQRQMLEDELRRMFLRRGERSLIVRGVVTAQADCWGYKDAQKKGCVTTVDMLPTEELKLVLENAGWIYCRSGYSSLMDLAVLRMLDKAVLYATPGQPEQEYLKRYNESKFSLFY